MKTVCILALVCVFVLVAAAQTPAEEKPPIIDMHLHGSRFWTNSDGTPLRRFCFPEPCFHAPARVEKVSDVLALTLEAMKQQNIVLGVLSDRPPQVLEWEKTDPDRFMLGFFMNHPSEVGLPELREQFRSGEFQVLGELAVGLRLNPVPNLESRYLLTTLWCVMPPAWGLWAMLTPRSWVPHRLPLWGAILGLPAGLLAVFVLDLPAQFRGEPLPAWLRGVAVLFAIGVYYLLWLLVRRVYRALAAPGPASTPSSAV